MVAVFSSEVGRRSFVRRNRGIRVGGQQPLDCGPAARLGGGHESRSPAGVYVVDAGASIDEQRQDLLIAIVGGAVQRSPTQAWFPSVHVSSGCEQEANNFTGASAGSVQERSKALVVTPVHLCACGEERFDNSGMPSRRCRMQRTPPAVVRLIWRDAPIEQRPHLNAIASG